MNLKHSPPSQRHCRSGEYHAGVENLNKNEAMVSDTVNIEAEVIRNNKDLLLKAAIAAKLI